MVFPVIQIFYLGGPSEISYLKRAIVFCSTLYVGLVLKIFERFLALKMAFRLIFDAFLNVEK
jgi:hypothetical protein